MMNSTTLTGLVMAASLLHPVAYASQSCTDSADTYSYYDNHVSQRDVKRTPSEYYVMSYSWSPDHCRKRRPASKQPGGKDYLQCGSGRKFGYVLHGLWPQGTLHDPGNYPRACRGDQPQIPRDVLEPFLCMTPSTWLLQHEYEFHGTCMPGATLSSPAGYFKQAQTLHTQLKLPDRKLPDNRASVRWLIRHNPGLKPGMFYYSRGEWRFCYNADFKPMHCPRAGAAKRNANHTAANPACHIKGNISTRTKKKLYYLPGHRAYYQVLINRQKGERCFSTEAEAIAAGWRKAS